MKKRIWAYLDEVEVFLCACRKKRKLKEGVRFVKCANSCRSPFRTKRRL